MKKVKGFFTLIELLTVITVIIMLMSILLPALNRSKATARAIQCTSNMRVIGVATAAYLGDSDNYLPPTITTSASPYFTAMENYTGINAENSKAGIKGAGIYHCPGDNFREQKATAEQMRLSYGLNTYANATSNPLTPQMRNITKIRSPSLIIYRADACNFSTTVPCAAVAMGVNTYPFNAGTAIDNVSYGAIDFRHNSAANILWMDMHCSKEKIDLIYGTTTTYLYQAP